MRSPAEPERVQQDEAPAMRPIRPTGGGSLRAKLLGHMPAAVLIALCVGTTMLSPHFLSAGNLTNVLVQASVMSIVAMGMTFVIVGGGFDLSVGAVVALSGCVAAMVMPEMGLVAGVVAGVAVAALVGVVNGAVVAWLGVNPFIATLGTMTLIRGAVYLLTDGAPVPRDGTLPAAFLAFGVEKFLGLHFIVWVPLLVLLAVSWIMAMTPYGRGIYATGGNREAAYLSGISVKRITLTTYVWCASLAGLAGVMLASRLQSGQPTSGEFYELTAIAAVVLGGASLHGGDGKHYKSVIGVFIMVVLSNSLNLMNIGSYWQRVAVGLVIVAAAAADQVRRAR